MEPRLRSRFFRTLIESMRVSAGSGAMARLRAQLPERLTTVFDDAMLGSSPPSHTVSLDDAEALLFEVEAILGDGSGRILEDAGRGLAARMLTEGNDGFVASDLLSAVRRLESPLAQALSDAALLFEVNQQERGFVLDIGVAGRPRLARLLRHLVTGYIHSAATGAGSVGTRLRSRSEIAGDRGRIIVEFALEETETTREHAAPNRRRSSVSLRSGGLTAEVERILGSGITTSEHPNDRQSGVSSQRPSVRSTALASGLGARKPRPQ